MERAIDALAAAFDEKNGRRTRSAPSSASCSRMLPISCDSWRTAPPPAACCCEPDSEVWLIV